MKLNTHEKNSSSIYMYVYLTDCIFLYRLVAGTGFTRPSSPDWRILNYMMKHYISLLYYFSMTLTDWVRCSYLLG